MSLFQILKSAWQLPLADLNYVTSSVKISFFSYAKHYKKRGLVLGALVFLAKAMFSVIKWRPQREAIRNANGTQVLFAQETQNQAAAIQPVSERLFNCATLQLRGEGQLKFPDAQAHVFSLIFFPMVLVSALSARGYERLGYRYVFHEYWLTYGYYITARLLIRRLSPSILVVANDHNMRTRVLQRAARDEGVTSMYLQHASVSPNFPPLTFDVAFLDGRDALEKYDQPGSEGCETFLTGFPKSDIARRSIRERRSIRTAAVCPGILDPEDAVYEVVSYLAENCPGLKLRFRPHPADKRDWRAIQAEFRSGVGENSFEFLLGTDAIITGHSNIALEAALAGVVPIYYDFSSTGGDVYGFRKRGLVAEARDLPALVEILSAEEAGPNPARRVAYYHATVGTAFDGRSGELVARLITEAVAGGIDKSKWQLLPASHVTAYTLREH